MTSTPRPSSPPRFSFGATESGSSGPSYGSSFAALDQARFISLSDAPTNASPEQLFSLFVGLAAEIHTPDLVGASSELENLVNKDVAISHIHTAYIGSGGSFTVRAWRLGRGGRSLALKSAMPSSYTFTEKDERQRLTDIIMELRALSHPSLRGRDHVVKLLGLGWETDSFEEVRKWPVLILELAEGGTLMDLLRRKEESLDGQGKLNICLDVAMGLASLQECGIIHGDLKPQNVLMFLSSPGEENDLKWTAKLGDFGGAVLDIPDNSLNVLRTGTQPWNAPEWRELLTPAGMMLTDVYSLGLVFWSIAADGADPFRDHAEILGLREESTHFEWNRDIQDLKHRGPHFLTKLCEAGRSSLCATDLSLMERLLSLTVQLEPNLRRLESVIDCLSEATERQYVRDSSAYTAPTYMPSYKLKSMEDVLVSEVFRQLCYHFPCLQLIK
jgi:serine/threonine protein kinase